MSMKRFGPFGLLLLLIGCGEDAPVPVDPLAEAYCAACSEETSCERLVTEALFIVCPETTQAYYQCVTDNSCDPAACSDEWAAREFCMGNAPRDKVRIQIQGLSPSANLGHRGSGETASSNPFPENSLNGFTAAIIAGADGVELDVQITADNRPIVIHDDTLDRTTNCTGCVNQMTFDELRLCRLLDGEGGVTDQKLPALLEVYTVVSGDSLVNIEIKTFGDDCASDTVSIETMVVELLDGIESIGVAERTIFSSLDESIVQLVKAERPGYYSALMSETPGPALIEKAIELEQDAIHPSYEISAEDVQSALDAGLQVNVWVVNGAALMQEQIDKGVTGIITDEPEVLAEVLAEQP
jgi:glycerophosphoryl diester phosphodiesterase